LNTCRDTSAAINAFVSAKVSARLDSGDHYIRLHLLSEFFATMTGRGVAVKDANGTPARLKISPTDAASWLRKFSSRVKIVELDVEEILGALDEAQRKNVQGGKVYDFIHAVAADKIEDVTLVTRNAKDFSGLTAKATVEWP
jgi:predicted nucleic acid-binding protein